MGIEMKVKLIKFYQRIYNENKGDVLSKTHFIVQNIQIIDIKIENYSRKINFSKTNT